MYGCAPCFGAERPGIVGLEGAETRFRRAGFSRGEPMQALSGYAAEHRASSPMDSTIQKLSASDPKRPGAAAARELPLWRWLAGRSGSMPQDRPFVSPKAAARARWKGCHSLASSKDPPRKQPPSATNKKRLALLQAVAVHGGRGRNRTADTGIFNQGFRGLVRSGPIH